MTRLVRERVKAEKGRPLFGTVVVDCDLIILLVISDRLLAERAAKRSVDLLDAKNMRKKIKADVESSGIRWIEFSVG